MKTTNFLYQKLETISDSVRLSMSYDGVPITDGRDLEKLRDAFRLWCYVMWDYADLLDRDRLYDTLPQLFYKLCGCDIKLLVKLLDDMRSAFYSLPMHTSLAISVFKGRRLGGSLSSGHVIMPMEAHCNSSKRSSNRALNTLFCFLLKLNIQLDIGTRLEDEYIADENRLRTLVFPDQMVTDLQKIMTGWFQDFRVHDENPRHGNGAVAGFGRIPISKKYPELGMDLRLRYWLSRERHDYLLDYVRPVKDLTRQAEVLFVPKSLKTYRVICKEPATLQYWQQMASEQITRHIRNHSHLSKKIDLNDQEKSRHFCRQASKSRDYATIDLSRASDSVSLALVKKIFRYTPLLRALIATRSDSVLLPSGQQMDTAKFAPMGSALCFPVECIIFAGICEMAIAYSSGRKNRYRVYGDDIIIHRDHVPNLMIILDKLGFIPNKEKSYANPSCSYRESCGEEAIDGSSIAPVRLSRSFSGLSIRDDKQIPRLVDLANTFFQHGLTTARRAVIKVLLQLKTPPLFSVPQGIGIWSFQPTNFSCKKKKLYGEYGIVHGALISKPQPCVLANDDIRLHEWLRSEGHPDEPLNIEKTRVVWQAITSPRWFSTIEVAKVTVD